ncbi:hypothetical protein BDQ12DRAFT_353060 [Crucibulum laeve]|uniref:Uncharacterized protein n=1 Tax=Crucibulum laeve TaxID=68775 RepID=A0A5C3MCF3_9AGAR|nr:hypothetical protein BDQ12DRAFT_353060 [Crucibulum laeve]
MAPFTTLKANQQSPSVSADSKPLNEVENTRLGAISPIPLPANPKDVRAFEHNRQRLKKAADLVKMRARKEQSLTYTGRVLEKSASALEKERERERERERSIRADELEMVDGPMMMPPPRRRHPTDEFVLPETKREVKLTDLVVTKKARKGKDLTDFEVIPHIRSVIVLDDAISHDVELDEPWEYIDGVDDDDSEKEDPREQSSYAKVAALGK